jgi:NADH-quinone oxidoreductase subunit N
LGLFNSGVAAFYYLRLLTSAYSKPSDTLPMESMARVTPGLLIALLLTVAVTLILGIVPGQVLTRAKAGAATLYPAAETAPATAQSR